jgi:FAD/FMN-containing dehydrogenase
VPRSRDDLVRIAPDISTAGRATVGGMMANNSSGARSVLYGKTIDHVLEQEVMLRHRARGRTQLLAGRNVEALYPHAAAGRKIIFCEPSCLSALLTRGCP